MELVKFKANLEVLIAIICFPAVAVNQAAIAFPLIYYQFCKVKYIRSIFFQLSFAKLWTFMEESKFLSGLPPFLSLINKLSGGGFQTDNKDSKSTEKKPGKTSEDEIEELDTDKMKKVK